MECPYCGEDLLCEDYYGFGIPETPEFKKVGDIYRCQNDDCTCVGVDMPPCYFHTDQSGDLHDGYPC